MSMQRGAVLGGVRIDVHAANRILHGIDRFLGRAATLPVLMLASLIHVPNSFAFSFSDIYPMGV
jgi:hypothetical protein